MNPTKQEKAIEQVYLVYRIALSLTLLALFYIDQNLTISGQYHTRAFFYTAIFYFLVTTLTVALSFFTEQSFSKKSQFITILIDIIALTLIVEFSGGIVTGIAILLIPPVAASSIFFAGITANFLAALTTISILFSTYYSVLIEKQSFSLLASAGFLGIAFFITSLLVQRLAKNIRATHVELEEQSDEINYLELLNEHIVQRLRTGIIVFDNNNTIKLSNDAAQKLLGRAFIPGYNIDGAFEKEFNHWKNQTQRQSTFQQQAGLPEVKVNFIDNSTNNNTREIIAFIENTTELSQQAQQIKLASLGRLSASIAHEIRNPLSAISHSTQLLNESDEMNPQDKRLLEIINTHIHRLNNIIDNTLSISKRDKPNIGLINLNDFITKIIEEQLAKFSKDIIIKKLTDCELQTVADKTQIAQIITNLLENALHYSHAKTGNNWAEITLDYDDSERSIIKVYDHGPGISHENISNIFEPFYTTRKSGTGLGLFIAKELCELNHAELDYVIQGDEKFFQIRFAHPGKVIN